MPKKQWAPLTSVETISGTAQDDPKKFRGFVTVRAVAQDGSIMMGQLDPATVRNMALQFLETAEAAETDAIVMSLLTRDMSLDSNMAAAFVMAMRSERNQ